MIPFHGFTLAIRSHQSDTSGLYQFCAGYFGTSFEEVLVLEGEPLAVPITLLPVFYNLGSPSSTYIENIA
jgi:hypothetical protein